VTLRWLFLGDADEYKVTVEIGVHDSPGWQPYRETNVTREEYTLDFVGARRGRWKVTPILRNGRSGPSSEWSTFRFARD
jgi:hypothetical protein